MGNLYGGTLVLGNGFSSVFNKFGSDMNSAGNKFKQFCSSSESNASKSSNAWKNSFGEANKSFDNFHNNVMGKIGKITAGFLTMKGAIGGIKEILKSGSEFQNASVFLQSAYGEKEGKNKFKFATNFANKTPFEESEVANSLARTKILGLKDDEKSFNMYSDVGSMAKITGTGDLSSAIDAISDMKNGEWERLQTILGIKRSSLEDYASSKGMEKFSDKKGQITNQDALMKAFESYLGDKGITGMTEKYANTLSGRMSTLSGNFKKALAELGGIKDDGTLEQGGLFDQACKGIEKLIVSVNTFAKSPSFDKLKDALGKLGEGLIKCFDYITTHPDTVSNLVKLGTAFVGLKVVSGLVSPFLSLAKGLSTLKTVLGNGTIGKTSNTSSKIANSAIAGAVVGHTVVSNDSLLHKVGNAINPANLFLNKDGEKEDYLAQIYAGASKASIWGLNKLGIINDNNANYGYSNADKYVQNANDYMNGRTDKLLNLRDMNSGITNNVNINVEKIEKTADSEAIMMDLTNKLNKLNTRNSVYY